MIHDVSELLSSLAMREVAILEDAGIRHAPTIGEMYEGLTADLLARAIPPGLDLRVVSGFAYDHEGNLSNQIDCMLVKGSGTKLPHTNKYKWHIRNVVAVVEVKKDLFSKGMDEAYHQLRGVLDIHSNWIQNDRHESVYNIAPSLRVFSEITGILAPPYKELGSLPLELQHIYHAVLGDQIAPIRIALGYGGFKSEYSLRKGFVKFLEHKELLQGYGPQAFPHQIVAGHASLVKFSGHPYRAAMKDGKMLIMASSPINPILIMLELIWTRLTYMQAMPELFGDDLQMEGFSSLLWGKVARHPQDPNRCGWTLWFDSYKKEELETSPAFTDWEPPILTVCQYVVVNALCEGKTIDVTDSALQNFAHASGEKLENFVDDLIDTRLIARNGTTLELITTNCMCAILPDGRYVAADDNTGRLTRWITKLINPPH